MPHNETTPLTDMYAAFRAEEFSGIPSNEWYLQGPGEIGRTVIRDTFIADESIDDPNILYTKTSTIDFRELESLYMDLLAQAQDSGDDVYYEQVARKLAEMYRHQESARLMGSYSVSESFIDQQHLLKDELSEALQSGDDESYQKIAKKLADLRIAKKALQRNGKDVRDKTLSAERAMSMNEELFGELKQEDFAIALAPYIQKAQELTDILPEARDILERVGESWDRNQGSFDFAIEPETLVLLKDDLLAIFPGLGEALAPHEDRKVGADEAVLWANKVLDAVEMRELGWNAVVAPNKKSAETVVRKKLIEFGAKRADFGSTTTMNETIVHEVIGHAWRAMQAQAQENPTLHSKMPGTDDFEESFATALQQLISQEPRIAGQRYVLAYGLSKGMDRDGEVRSFRETSEILADMIVIDNAIADKPVDVLAAQQKAYGERSRVGRGGALDARDLSYFLGCKKSYTWMNEIAKLPVEERRAKLKWVLSGLFDPTNPEQADKFPEVAERNV